METINLLLSNKGYIKLDGKEILEASKAEILILPIVEEEKVKRYEGKLVFEYYELVSNYWIKQRLLDMANGIRDNLKFEITNYNEYEKGICKLFVSDLGKNPIKIQEINGQPNVQMMKIELPFDIENLLITSEPIK